jgi:hypothetical protein
MTAPTFDALWQELKGARTSPEDYPDMALITHEEARAFFDAGVEAAAAVADGIDGAGRDWAPNSFWGTISRETAAKIRALLAPAAAGAK